MLIKIIAGAYGLPNGNLTELKTRNSAPFSISESEGKRLIGLGIAEQVKSEVATANTEHYATSETNHKPEKKTDRNGVSAKKRSGASKEDKNTVLNLEAEMPE